MARNYDIVDFRETDDLSPTTTRKLNHNFRRFIDLIESLQIGGVDTGDVTATIVGGTDDSLGDRIDDIEDWISNHSGGGGGGGEGGDCSCGAYTVVPWTDSSYDEDKHYDEDNDRYVAVHKVSGYKTWAELGFEPIGTYTDINAIINGTYQPEQGTASLGTPELPDDEMCCGSTAIIKVPWTDSSYDENRYYDEDLGIDVSLHTFAGYKTFEELGLEPIDPITAINSLFPNNS